MSKKDWEIYEEHIFSKLKSEFPKAEILKNEKIKGVFSKVNRQIDILVTTEEIGKKIKIVIDCKRFSKNVHVKHIESFIGFTEDVNAHLGILITNKGYSKAAKRRVQNYNKEIILDVVNFEKLEEYEFQLNFNDCHECTHAEKYYSSYLGLWSEIGVKYEENEYFVQLAECNYCGTEHVKCTKCGTVFSEPEVGTEYCACGIKYGYKIISNDGSEYELVIEEVTF